MNWDFVAGFFDGEGCVFFKKNQSVILQMTNTNREVLEQIATLTGGNIIVKKRNQPPPVGIQSRLPIYDLIVRDHRDVLVVAQELVKRCIIKREKLIAIIQHIQQRKWHHNVLPKDVNVISNLYFNEKKSMSEIAKIYGITPVCISRFLRKNGITRNWRKEEQLRKAERVAQLRKEGYMYKEIKVKLGISESSACHLTKQYGFR